MWNAGVAAWGPMIPPGSQNTPDHRPAAAQPLGRDCLGSLSRPLGLLGGAAPKHSELSFGDIVHSIRLPSSLLESFGVVTSN